MRVEIQKPRENRDFTARGALARRISTRLKSLISHPSIREASFLAGFRACPPRERLLSSGADYTDVRLKHGYQLSLCPAWEARQGEPTFNKGTRLAACSTKRRHSDALSEDLQCLHKPLLC